MIISLQGAAPIAVGHRRHVYQHPDDPGLLIKVMRADNRPRHWYHAPWYRRLARTGPYATYMREFTECLASRRYAKEPSPLVRIVGLVDTDIGLGLVAERVVGRDGGLAPSLAAMVREQGMTPAIASLINRLFDEVLRHYVIVSDLRAENVVHGTDSAGGPRLVIVDGFGPTNRLPLNGVSRRYDVRRTRRQFDRLRVQLAQLARQRDPVAVTAPAPSASRAG
ncbi:YrbL family protein [Luteibacter sahnii]|jgi:hypothetical protein|uniref:YrbL family protein n=1 Tax=Luteibacter sahnii TaxID=3021977 RepID=UPI002A6A97F0|nr:YrbL family protein [Luteibacter sp. PPL193]MDY1549756.1 YrbL family protein [Luteibacter sp. PPL193]